MLDLGSLCGQLGVEEIWLKHEGQNPTGSHKDRMSAQAVARALDIGAKEIVLASSGNAGVSAAAYAAAAGLRCEVVVTAECLPSFVAAMRLHGARVVATRANLDRWRYVNDRVSRDGAFPLTNFSLPPVGSNPFGVEGYKVVAYEIFEQLGGRLPTVALVPTSRGDLIWGLHLGFREIVGQEKPVPRLVAVEPFSRIGAVLDGADYRGNFPGATRQSSIAGSTVTFQAVRAVQLSGGLAVAVDDASAAASRNLLARRFGIRTELSSAAALSAAVRMSERGLLNPSDSLVIVATSLGMHDAVGDEPEVEFVA